MPSGVEANIFRALMEHLMTLVFTPALPIAAPNVVFPPAGQTKPDNYLSVTFLPNRTDTLSIGNGHQRHQGILQVSVFWKSGNGIVKPLDVADRIIKHFAKGTVLEGQGLKVKIGRKPWAAPPLQDAAYIQVPVSIEYVTFAQ